MYLLLRLYKDQSDTATLSQPMAWVSETCLKTGIIFAIPLVTLVAKIFHTYISFFFSFNEYFMIKAILLFKKKKSWFNTNCLIFWPQNAQNSVSEPTNVTM